MEASTSLTTVPKSLLDIATQPRSGFFAGLSAPFRGFSYLIKRPALWWLSAVPSLVALVIGGGLSALAVSSVPGLISWLMPAPTTRLSVVGVGAVVIAATIVAVLVAFVLGFKLAQPLSGPALERLARSLEGELGVRDRPSVPIWREITRSIVGNLIGLSIGLPILIVLTLIGFFIPVSAIVVVPLQFLVTGVMVTWDLLDYPFSIRGLRVGFRLQWMKQNLGASLGFGLALGLVFLIPCVQVLLLPVGTVGATWLVFEREQAQRRLG